MRTVRIKFLLAGVAVATFVQVVTACGDAWDSGAIPFPGQVRDSMPRGDYLLCLNDANHICVVDLKRSTTHDIGKADGKRWREGDVADGAVMLMDKDRLTVVSLQNGKTVHSVPLGTDQVIRAFGFAGKGRGFVLRNRSVDIIELASAETLHSVAVGNESWRGWSGTWQKVGKRLYIPGPASTVCVIDLDAGKLLERFPVESRAGIAAMQVEGSTIYCIGSPFGWGARIDHLTCFDMQKKKAFLFDLPRGELTRPVRFAGGPYGTAYLIEGNRIDRYTMYGDVCGTFNVPSTQQPLTVWHERAVVAVKGEIRLLDIKETPVTRK